MLAPIKASYKAHTRLDAVMRLNHQTKNRPIAQVRVRTQTARQGVFGQINRPRYPKSIAAAASNAIRKNAAPAVSGYPGVYGGSNSGSIAPLR